MLDEREGPVPAADLHRSFTRKPPWQRILVLVAGPAFNILFAIVVLWGMFWWTGTDEAKPIVGEVAPSSVAAQAGLRQGDEIQVDQWRAGRRPARCRVRSARCDELARQCRPGGTREAMAARASRR